MVLVEVGMGGVRVRRSPPPAGHAAVADSDPTATRATAPRSRSSAARRVGRRTTRTLRRARIARSPGNRPLSSTPTNTTTGAANRPTSSPARAHAATLKANSRTTFQRIDTTHRRRTLDAGTTVCLFEKGMRKRNALIVVLVLLAAVVATGAGFALFALPFVAIVGLLATGRFVGEERILAFHRARAVPRRRRAVCARAGSPHGPTVRPHCLPARRGRSAARPPSPRSSEHARARVSAPGRHTIARDLPPRTRPRRRHAVCAVSRGPSSPASLISPASPNGCGVSTHASRASLSCWSRGEILSSPRDRAAPISRLEEIT